MHAIAKFALVFALILASACQRGTPDDNAHAGNASVANAAAQTPPPEVRPAAPDDVLSHEPHAVQMPPADTPTPALAEGAAVTYACEDGTLVVSYGAGVARVTLPDGGSGEATLSAAQSAKAGGEVYVGQRLGLQRIGNAVELQQADGPTRRCTESSSSA